MSAEERFVRIENLLSTLAEYGARHAVKMEEMAEMHRLHKEEMADIRQAQQQSLQSNQQFKEMVFTAGAKIFTLMRKNQEQIRELREGQKELQELHRETEDKVHMLMNTVDRIIRDRNA